MRTRWPAACPYWESFGVPSAEGAGLNVQYALHLLTEAKVRLSTFAEGVELALADREVGCLGNWLVTRSSSGRKRLAGPDVRPWRLRIGEDDYLAPGLATLTERI